MNPIKNTQLWLNTDNHYRTVMVAVSLIIAGVVAMVLFWQNNSLIQLNEKIKEQNDTIIGLTIATKDNTDRGIIYLDCIIKIFLTPPTQRTLQGSPSDPLAAAEACRVQAGIPAETGVNATPEPNSNPSDEELSVAPPSNPAPTPGTTPPAPQTQNPPSNPPVTVSLPGPLPTVSVCLPFSNICARVE